MPEGKLVTLYSEMKNHEPFIKGFYRLGIISHTEVRAIGMYDMFVKLGDLPKMEKYHEIGSCYGVSYRVAQETIGKLHKMVRPICQDEKCSSDGNGSPV